MHGDRRAPRAAPAAIRQRRSTLGRLTLNVPGRHNLQNALAAVAVGLELGLSVRSHRRRPARSSAAPSGGSRCAASRTASSSSTTTAIIRPRSRRCSPRRARSSRRIVVAFQPHRFTRTAALMDAFGPALAGADHIVLTDIYAAGEEPIAGRDARRAGGGDPARAWPRRSTWCRALDDVVAGARARRAAGRRRDHARRRIDRHALPIAWSQRARAGRGRRVSPVAAPADRRFRRAHVKPARQRGALARARRPALSRTACVAALVALRRLPRRRGRRRTRTCCRSIASSCAATSGCRTAKCWRC